MILMQLAILIYFFLPISQGKSNFGSFTSFDKHSLKKTKEKPKKRLFFRSSTCLFVKSVRGGEKSSLPSSPFLPKKIKSNIDIQSLSSQTMNNTTPLNFVFSDVDGTLVHYPEANEDNDNDIIYLPPSSTGMRGIISSKTLKLSQALRHECNVKLVLVSGMRTSTLLKRLPYLPKADAYASEAGGRIFYPVENINDYNGKIVEPVNYDDASDADLKAFGLVEDMDWREELSIENAAGTDGYIGDVMNAFLNVNKNEEVKPINDRSGTLWNFAKTLEHEGFVLDYKGYSCCFRVNRKQQLEGKVTNEDFDRLSLRDVSELGLASSVNLGCVDFYPIKSGKKNCCSYLAKKFMKLEDRLHGDITDDDMLLERALCLCDDDNDLEMASACGKVFLPSVTSESMAEAARLNPEKILIAENKDENVIETLATERALLEAIKLLKERALLRP